MNSIYSASCLINKSLRIASRSMSSSKLSVMSTKIMTLNEDFDIVVLFSKRDIDLCMMMTISGCSVIL